MNTRCLLPVLALLAVAGELRAQERVLLRRYADMVVVRSEVDGPEEVLYYFDPTRELPQGAQIQQGSGGFSELHFSGGGKIASHASAQFVLERLAPEGDIVRVPMLNLLEVFGGTRKLQLVLPGGTRCLLLESKLLIEMLPGRLRIRNQKGEPVAVTGLIGVSPPLPGDEPQEPGQGRVLVSAGQEIQIPMYSGEQPTAGMSTRRWAGRLVRHGPGADVAAEGPRLRVEREADGILHETANVEVGGVATMPGRGRLVIHDPRPMADTTPSQLLVPPTEPAPADAPADSQAEGTRPSTEEDSP